VGPFGEAVTPTLPKLDYQETDAGIRQIATRGKNNVRISDWTFPNNNHILIPSSFKEDPWIDLGLWIVPNDDRNTTRFQLYSVPYESAEAKARIIAHFERYAVYTPAEHHEELFEQDVYPDDPLLELTNAQDFVAAVGQGVIVDRSKERLASSDAGVVLLRRVLQREMAAIEEGGKGKEWRRLEHAVDLPMQQPEKSEV
jgi:5,5'-dehydrodivanillate O-demethylase